MFWHDGNEEWQVCIGKVPTADGAKLRYKIFGFGRGTTEADAKRRAAELRQRWKGIKASWARVYQGLLEAIGDANAATPHWTKQLLGQEPGVGAELTDQEIQEFQSRRMDADEIAELAADFTMATAFAHFKIDRLRQLHDGDFTFGSFHQANKDIACCLRAFPPNLKMCDLTADIINQAKSNLLQNRARRTVLNYFNGLKLMLDWFYAAAIGKAQEKPDNYPKIMAVKRAKTPDIRPYTNDDLKVIFGAAPERTKLWILLGLNCGMEPVDIGNLHITEFNMEKGFVYWKREKTVEQNAFATRHDLWPETLTLVKKYIQPSGTKQRDFTDGQTIVNLAHFAFLNQDGGKLYYRTPSGSVIDLVANKAFRDLNLKLETSFRFTDLRKTTANRIGDGVRSQAAGDIFGVHAATETVKQFLSQAIPGVSKFYEKLGMTAFDRMNHYLKAVGDGMRTAGVFTAKPQDRPAAKRRPSPAKRKSARQPRAERV